MDFTPEQLIHRYLVGEVDEKEVEQLDRLLAGDPKLRKKFISEAGTDASLREIALERDQIVHDRFDHLIKDCKILDLPDETSAEDLFAAAADALADRLDIDRDTLLDKFRVRETQSSTVIMPGLAIPHIIVDGTELFDLLVVRCAKGAVFGPDKPPIQAAFVLVGSDDQRNYHLRALMAIAHIVQEHNFMSSWLAAPQAEHLRDILLLSNRQRDGDGNDE